jgi:hypothetical protein
MSSQMQGFKTTLEEFAAFLPNLLAGLVVLLIGWLLAMVLGGVTKSILRRAGFEQLLSKLGLGHTWEPGTGARWAGKVVYLVVLVATLMQVARIWELTFVAAGFARLVAYFPHVLGAAVILGVAVYAGNWLRERLFRSSITGTNGDGQLRVLPGAARSGVIGLGVFMALRELQIAPEIVNLAFSLTLGAVALATALAFGLGGREVAGRIAQQWYDRRRQLRRQASAHA